MSGGGYDHHSPREGEAIAIKMLELGYNAVVLRYSLAPFVYPTQIYEAAYTVKWVRDNAKEWDVNPERLYWQDFLQEVILPHVLELCGVVIWLQHLQKNILAARRNM